jgi:hypothetical protein
VPKDENELLAAQIRAARLRGDFDELPECRAPLRIDDLDGLSAEQRLQAMLVRSRGKLSDRRRLVQEIRARRAMIAGTDSELERDRMEVTLRKRVDELTRVLQSDA